MRPSLTTGIARDDAGASSFSDIQAPPRRATFFVVSWSSDEYRVLPASPVTVGQSREAALPPPPDCTATTTGRANIEASATATLQRYRDFMKQTLDRRLVRKQSCRKWCV